MTRSTQRAGQIVSGYLTEAQEINTEFARRATETWIEAFRKQTELNQRMVQRLYGEAEGQTGAWQGLVQDWMSAYSVPFIPTGAFNPFDRSEEHTSELQSRQYLVCRLLLEKKKKIINILALS